MICSVSLVSSSIPGRSAGAKLLMRLIRFRTFPCRPPACLLPQPSPSCRPSAPGGTRRAWWASPPAQQPQVTYPINCIYQRPCWTYAFIYSPPGNCLCTLRWRRLRDKKRRRPPRETRETKTTVYKLSSSVCPCPSRLVQRGMDG